MVGVLQLFAGYGQSIQKASKARWMFCSCFANNLPLVSFLHTHADTAWRAEALENAISVNAWDVVRFLLANDTTEVSASAFTEVLRAGNLEIAVQILLRQPTLRKRSRRVGLPRPRLEEHPICRRGRRRQAARLSHGDCRSSTTRGGEQVLAAVLHGRNQPLR